MTTKDAPAVAAMKHQEYCIDLPGESVQCWVGGGTDQLKVILRKHRDVVIDIKLGDKKTYILETTESDFYNVRDKKLIYASRGGKVIFKDGERLHVWVSRNFRGELVVKCEEQVISKVRPNDWDSQQYGSDSKEKPAPIIIAVGTKSSSDEVPRNVVSTVEPSTSKTSGKTAEHSFHPIIRALQEEAEFPVVCVVDGHASGMPNDLVEYFKKGGDHSGFADIDPYHVATRNWLWGQAVGTLAYARDNWEWLRACLDGKTSKGFRLVQAKVHYVRGKVRFYFSGYSKTNSVFGRGGLGPGNKRIMSIFAGMGKTSSTFKAALNGVAGSFKGNALVSFIFGSITSIAEWKDDAKKDGFDLAAALIMAAIKAIVVGAVVSLIVTCIVFVIFIGADIALPVIVIGVVTIGVSYLVNWAVEAADKSGGHTFAGNDSNNDGMSPALADFMRETNAKIRNNWAYLMNKMPRDYKEVSF